MADQKVTQKARLTTPSVEDLLMIIDDPNGTPVTKAITIKNLFAAVPGNTVFLARVRTNANTIHVGSNTVHTGNVNFDGTGLIKANNFHLTVKSNPASNNATTAGRAVGSFFASNTYIYFVVNATTIKRVALSTF